MNYTFLEHTADIKFVAKSKTLNKTFKDSAYALLNIIKEDKKISFNKLKKIKIKSNNLENLLYKFLEEFLFLLDSQNFITETIHNLKIDKNNFKLECILRGDDNQKYNINNKVKAITYDDLEVRKQNNFWLITCVLDV